MKQVTNKTRRQMAERILMDLAREKQSEDRPTIYPPDLLTYSTGESQGDRQ